jgi:protein-tyrosine phosphatase
MNASERVSVLFVCLGNICRSPLAEGVFRDLVVEASLEDRIRIDSAGTGAYHVGEAPDARAVGVALEHGVQLTGLARQVTANDLQEFDWVVAMDASNKRHLEALSVVDAKRRIRLLRDFDPEAPGTDVPDPYYGGAEGFEEVFRMVDRACRNLLAEISD